MLAEFAPKCLDGYARANRQKASGIAAKETILRVHLVPSLGAKRLDAITNEVVQSVKRSLREKSAKTVNNVLTVLNKMLKTAIEWEELDRMPCSIRLLPCRFAEGMDPGFSKPFPSEFPRLTAR